MPQRESPFNLWNRLLVQKMTELINTTAAERASAPLVVSGSPMLGIATAPATAVRWIVKVWRTSASGKIS